MKELLLVIQTHKQKNIGSITVEYNMYETLLILWVNCNIHGKIVDACFSSNNLEGAKNKAIEHFKVIHKRFNIEFKVV